MNGRLYERNNTFSKRPGVPQVASYVIFALEVVLFYSVILPALDRSPQIALGVAYTLSLLALVASTIVSSTVDPSDQVMVLYRNRPRQEFQQFRSGYASKLLFCDYCRSYVCDKSRHCKACDRCVQNFDHHCMWINNCVGELNYRSFFVMILAAFANLVLYLVGIVVLTMQGGGPSLAAFAVAWVSGAVNAVFALLLANLIALHCYLMHKGISTYQFIMAQREEERKRKEGEAPKESDKIGMKDEMGKEEPIKQLKNIQSTSNVIKVKSSDNEHEQDSSSSISGKEEKLSVSKMIPNSVVFSRNDPTEKSEDLESSSNHKCEKFPNEGEVDSENESSVQLSQLFTRNKSLKLIFGQNEFYRPHRTTRQRVRQVKSRSMFAKL